MKALTICQPYAHLICIEQEKFVENREWSTKYRGPLLIHAGKSKKWLGQGDAERYDLTYGAVLGVCRLADCIHKNDKRALSYELQNGDKLLDHQHSYGPWFWVLKDVYPLALPYPCKGAQGLWNLDVKVLRFDKNGTDVTALSGLWDEDDTFQLKATA